MVSSAKTPNSVACRSHFPVSAPSAGTVLGTRSTWAPTSLTPQAPCRASVSWLHQGQSNGRRLGQTLAVPKVLVAAVVMYAAYAYIYMYICMCMYIYIYS